MRKRARGLMNELETSLRPLIRGSSFVKKKGKDEGRTTRRWKKRATRERSNERGTHNHEWNSSLLTSIRLRFILVSRSFSRACIN